MNAAELEHYLHQHIPISAPMGITVVESTPAAIRLRAALAPNLNHRSTAFGGSVAAVGILSGWSLLRVNLGAIEPLPHIVIQRTRVEYLDPILADFDALSLRPTDEKWDRFLRSLTRRGKARLDIETEIFAGDQRVGHLSSEFVALRAGAEQG
jgi:thioesterase domain-containing protein